MVDTIKYLGHIVSRGKVSVDPAQTEAIRGWPVSICVKEVQQFLGHANYYHQFIRRFAQITIPLTRLLQKGTDIVWSFEYKSAFQSLMDKLCSAPVLRLPDFQQPFVIETDCSDGAFESVLLQYYDNGYHPIDFCSCKLNPYESNYAPHDRELLAIYQFACKWW